MHIPDENPLHPDAVPYSNTDTYSSFSTSIKINTKEVIYDNDTRDWKYTGKNIDINTERYVDLGLPSGLLWATCNVGATLPEEYGDYFAWGETTTKTEYTEDNSLTYGLSKSELQSQGYIDSEGNLTPQYDAATANWGSSWRMPTKNELNELINNCTWTWTTQNGVKGYNVAGPNGASIFLPAAGYRNGSSLNLAGHYGHYWSSTLYEDNDIHAHTNFFGNDTYNTQYSI